MTEKNQKVSRLNQKSPKSTILYVSIDLFAFAMFTQTMFQDIVRSGIVVATFGAKVFLWFRWLCLNSAGTVLAVHVAFQTIIVTQSTWIFDATCLFLSVCVLGCCLQYVFLCVCVSAGRLPGEFVGVCFWWTFVLWHRSLRLSSLNRRLIAVRPLHYQHHILHPRSHCRSGRQHPFQ